MKKYLSIIAVTLFIAACGNDTPRSEEYRDSTSVTPQGPPDTSSAGDTTSYERMPNKTTDTTRH